MKTSFIHLRLALLLITSINCFSQEPQNVQMVYIDPDNMHDGDTVFVISREIAIDIIKQHLEYTKLKNSIAEKDTLLKQSEKKIGLLKNEIKNFEAIEKSYQFRIEALKIDIENLKEKNNKLSKKVHLFKTLSISIGIPSLLGFAYLLSQ